MKPRWLSLCLPLLLACGLAAAAQSQTPVSDRKKVIEEARHSYYSLRAAGLDEFRATIKPNWEQVLKSQSVSDPAQLQAALKLLNGLHFTMLQDKDGKVTITHHADTEPPNEQARKGFEDIYSGIDQAVSGFFATWSLFMLSPPFPAVASEYQLEDLGSQYRVSYKEGSSDIVTVMGKDLIVREIKVTAPEFISIIRPHVAQTAKGFVLTGYVGDYTPKSGPGVVHLDIKIDHTPVNGMQLPLNLIADTTLDGAPTHIELAFSQHEVKNH